MERLITSENLRKFAYVNDEICTKPIKGIVIAFMGMGNTAMFDYDPHEASYFAKKGILYMSPYNNPWAFMNRQTVAYTDEIIDVLIEKHGLSKDIPIIASGRSMGAVSTFPYSIYSKYSMKACFANCPPCDMVFHFTERDDLPRALYNSFYLEEGTMEDALKSISPIHLIDKLPKIKYHIFQIDNDLLIKKERHADVFVPELRKRGFDVEYDIDHNRAHCDLSLDMLKKYLDGMAEIIEKCYE